MPIFLQKEAPSWGVYPSVVTTPPPPRRGQGPTQQTQSRSWSQA